MQRKDLSSQIFASLKKRNLLPPIKMPLGVGRAFGFHHLNSNGSICRCARTDMDRNPASLTLYWRLYDKKTAALAMKLMLAAFDVISGGNSSKFRHSN
ncbi:MAG: hypothetical protein ABGW87_13075 [Sphingomonadaceae bacterium]